MTYDIEYTDTFGGDANYCWVRRATIEAPANASNRLLMRRAKAAIGLTGVRGIRSDVGDTLDIRPYGSATVLFVPPRD